ncbi:thymidine phosphorylase [Bemisia tabaci]|uniref:thymidine phosphorylase n=1 Tax=Bemisia tabaci TaxID=7038 RepID=UPI003B283C45
MENGSSSRGSKAANLNFMEILTKKRDGKELNCDEIKHLVQEIVNETVQESQIGAMLMAMYIQSLSIRETTYLTEAFIESGETLSWPQEWEALLVDKHSTGGVGDKVSIPLAPALAACGAKVPMVSGRGLGFTGGTLDKLESIPGFKVVQSTENLTKILDTVGCFIVGTTENLTPGDRQVYKFRNVTATVSNDCLITSSIISKKIAEGVKSLLLDIKVGKAAWCKDLESGRKLAKILISVAEEFGVSTHAFLTRMDEPVGYTVGNALEIAESVECLRGTGSTQLRQLVCDCGGELLAMSNLASSVEAGKSMIGEVLKNGKALEKFYAMICAQGVNENVAETLCFGDMATVLPQAKHKVQINSHQSGYIQGINGLILAEAAGSLGAGITSIGQKIDHSVGFRLLKTVGHRIKVNEPWVEIHFSSELDDDLRLNVENALSVSSASVESKDFLIQVISQG